MKEQLTRSGSDKMIAGVCGGLARSLGMDANLVRILWAVLSLFTGAPILIYAVMWLILTVDGQGPTGFDDLKALFTSKPQA
jgi:phage shock protein C